MQKILLSIVLMTGCTTPRSNEHTSTDLGELGNKAVATAFEQYKKLRETDPTSGCVGSTTHPRVIVTGFGLFSGVDFNISGVVVGSLADPAFFPSEVPEDTVLKALKDAKANDGLLTQTASGASSKVRVLKIGNKNFEVCLLKLDVIWDLAAAIIVTEMERFQPQFVMMTGRGAAMAVFESGALNDASIGSEGFDYRGNQIDENTPVKSYIIEGAPASLPMTWDNQLLHEKSKALIASLKHESSFAPEARPSNNYICNNVSYVLLAAAKNYPVILAGKKISLAPKFTTEPKIGFFHIASGASNEPQAVMTWAQVITTSISAQLSQ